jgi:formate/nitrite transporter
MNSLPEMYDVMTASAHKKANLPWPAKIMMGMAGGAAIAFGYMAMLHATAAMTAANNPFAGIIGASIFPVGLIIIILMGQELATGSMFMISFGALQKQYSVLHYLTQVVIITLLNLVGAFLVAFFLGHVTGIFSHDIYKTVLDNTAIAKLHYTPLETFFSGIGCNILVSAGVFIGLGAKDAAGKVLGLWFPIMAFIAIGFQHVVANMFLLPSAWLNGAISFGEMWPNLGVVFLGNVVGGLVVAFTYFVYFKSMKISK